MKVSVCIITYNQENYIEQAVAGVLMQKCNFDYEIIIGDDASTDGTQNILLNLKNDHPDKIKLLLRKKNIGMLHNFIETVKTAKGKYIALLEGDDYWIDPEKLQKQVGFLESNPEYVICSTAYAQLNQENNEITEIKNIFPSETLEMKDMLEQNYISTLTCVFKNNLLKTIPEEYFNLKIGDWPLHVMNAKYGKIKYFKNRVTGVYRIHDTGVWSKQKKGTKSLAYAEVYKFFKQISDKKYHPKIKQKIIENYYIAANEYLQQNDKKKARDIINKLKNETSFFSYKYIKIKLKYLFNDK